MSRREGWKRAPVVAGMALISASALFPLYFMASNAFRSNADYDASKVGLPSVFSFDTIQRAWEGASIPTYMRNSLIVVAGTVVLSIVVASMAGYSFSKLRWRPRSAVYLFVLAWIAVPPLILLVPLYVEMVNLDLYDTPWSLILIYSAVNLPFNTYLMTAYFRGVPDELVDAARLDGAGPHGVFVTGDAASGPPRAGHARDLQLPVGLERVHLRAAAAAQRGNQDTHGGRAPATGALQPRPDRPHGRVVHLDPAGDRRLPDLPAPSRPRRGCGNRALRVAAPTHGTTPLTGADRVLLTLKTLAGHSSGVSLDAISRELGAPKSSIHRALAALRRAGFADQDERGHYRLGSELVRITFDYHERRDVVDLVRPVLSTLSTWLSETAHYAQLEEAEVVYLAKIEPTGQAITMSSRIGGRNPAHSTGVGKALLAHVLADDDAVREFVARHGPLERRTENTLVSARSLADDLRVGRERGYALDREESELGVNCIAFPLFLGSGRRPAGAVSVSAVAMRTDVESLEAVAERIRSTIEDALGPVTRPVDEPA